MVKRDWLVWLEWFLWLFSSLEDPFVLVRVLITVQLLGHFIHQIEVEADLFEKKGSWAILGFWMAAASKNNMSLEALGSICWKHFATRDLSKIDVF